MNFFEKENAPQGYKRTGLEIFYKVWLGNAELLVTKIDLKLLTVGD